MKYFNGFASRIRKEDEWGKQLFIREGWMYQAIILTSTDIQKCF